MAQADNALRISELDFDSIRNNLKTYLKGQAEFTDYDFEGSGMSVLLDILAYNTHYMGYYLNMVGNEAFLDTAQIRSSVISHAKHSNYLPTSMRGSTAVVNVDITPNPSNPSEDNTSGHLTLPRYTRFVSAPINGVNYVFTNVDTYYTTKANGKFSYTNVVLKQGEPITQTYFATGGIRSFNIPSANVDTSTLAVTVQESVSNTHTETFILSDDLTEITSNSNVFFLDENSDFSGNYTITFGDGVLGKALSNDNIIIVNYIDTAGEYSNKVNNFTNITSVAGYQNVIVNSVSAASGGSAKEPIEQIKFRAPVHYTVQNRAVTRNDFESLLLKDYPNIDAVSVWSGDENDPPIYGKVFISLKPKENYNITLVEKERIKGEIIRNRSVLTVIPEIVDPDYTYLIVNATVNYNPALTTLDENQLRSLVHQSILDYKDSDLKTFASTFRLSKLQRMIDSSHESILGSSVKVFVQKRIEVNPLTSKNHIVSFKMPLYRGYLDDKFSSYPEFKVTALDGVERTVRIEDTPGSLTGVDSISMISTGLGYASIPTVTIFGDGNGATGVARVINGKVVGIDVINRGSDYSYATVTIQSDSGTGAEASVNLEAKNGILRTVYYRPNGEKVVVNENAGSINYATGVIELISLLPNSVISNDRYAQNVITLNALPYDPLITPLRDRILDIDESDPSSIIINMVPES